jgi:Flp pilus assembly protein TadD
MAQRWAKIEPAHTGPEAAMASIYEKQGRRELAVLHLLKALEIVPSESKVHENLAELYAQLGRKSEARRHFEQAIQWMDAESTEAIQAIAAKIEALK